MKNILTWTLPLVIAGASFSVSAEETASCVLPAANSKEERAVLQQIRKMADGAKSSFLNEDAEQFAETAENSSASLAESLNAIPEGERTEQIEEVLAGIKSTHVSFDEATVKAIAERIRCTIINNADSLIDVVAKAMNESKSDGQVRSVVALYVNYLGLDIGATIPFLKIKKHKPGGGFELAVGYLAAYGLKYDAETKDFTSVTERRFATGIAGLGGSVAKQEEKMAVPKVVLPGAIRVITAPKPATKIQDFYGFYAVGGVSTVDIGFANIRGQLGLKVAELDDTVSPFDSLINPTKELTSVMGGALTLGQQRGSYLANGRVYMFGNIPVVAEFVGSLFQDDTQAAE